MSHVSPKIAFCCALTSFTLLPSEQSLQAVKSSYARKSRAGSLTKSKCCSNCATDQGSCLKNDSSDKASQEVNVATLYEVERLCSMLRPSYLSHDSDFSVLLTLCRQYLMKEKGEAVMSALVRRKSGAQDVLPPTQEPTVKQSSAPVCKTVDVGSNVSNIVIPHTSPATRTPSQAHVKQEAVAPPPQTDTSSAVANHSIIQQLVLKQLSSDTVQTLLHLIQSGQISPVQLNQIMTKNPTRSMQILQNIVDQVKKGDSASKATSSQQAQPQDQQVPQPVPPQQVVVQGQPRASQPCYSVPQVLQSSSLGQRGHFPAQQQSSVRQQAPQQVRSQPPAAQPSAQPRVAGDQVLVQQQPAVSQHLPVRRLPSQQVKAVAQVQQPRILRGVQQIRPVLPSGSSIQVTSGGTIQVTQPVHIMTFSQSVPLQQSSAFGRENPLLIHSSSQMLTHLSGGSVRCLQQKPRVLRLPSATVTVETAKSQRPDLVAQVTNSTASQVPLLSSREGAGDRHYSINNLLFTGEQQAGALSITLPDKLPEISVDSVTDTLRALSDPSSPSGQVATKGPEQQLQGPVSQTISQLPGAQAARELIQIPAKVLVPTTLGQSRKSSVTSIQTFTQAQLLTSSAVAKSQMFRTPHVVTSLAQSAQAVHSQGQPLPSFSTLFASNQSPQLVTSTAVSPSPNSVTIPRSAAAVGSVGLAEGQRTAADGGKVENKTIKKNKEILAANKEEMMRLLRQAMTLKIDKKGTSKVAEVTGSQMPQQSSVSLGQTLTAALKSVTPHQSSTTVVNLSPSLARPIFQQSPGVPVHQPVASSQHSGKRQQNTLHLSVSQAAQPRAPAAGVEFCVAPQTMSSNPAVYSSLGLVSTGQKFSPASSLGYTNVKPQALISHSHTAVGKPVLGLHASSASAGVAISHLPSSSEVLGNAAVSDNSIRPMSTATSGFISSSQTPTSGEGVKAYSRADDIQSQTSQQGLGGDCVTSIPIPTSVLPEGGIIETGRSGDQSIATYRCIICAKAFMTLDALRFHVKQICKPGLSQPPNLGNRMAINKAQATEAGLETSTVFQCMRCYELCISEAGIRQHKLVCSKAPKPKSRSKSKAKAKVPTPEEEKATEAKVMELLNKCLGENREKLLQENQAQAAKQASDKKKPIKKRSSTDIDPLTSAGVAPAETAANIKRPKFVADTTVSAAGIGQDAVAVSTTGALHHSGNPRACAAYTNTAVPATTSSFSPSVSTPSSGPVVLASTPSCLAVGTPQASTPITVLSTAGTVVASSSNDAQCVYSNTKIGEEKSDIKVGSSMNYVTSTAENSIGIGAGTSTSKQTALAVPNTDLSDQKVTEQKPPKTETEPPPPQFKELSSSTGQSFYKCLNCGQTLCSRESFGEHWLECIIKKPLVVKPKHEVGEIPLFEGTNHSESDTSSESTGRATPNCEQMMASSGQAAKLSKKAKDEQTNNDKTCMTAEAIESLALSMHQVKQSVVLLEKVTLPQGIISSANMASCADESDSETVCEDSSDFSRTEKSGESTAESSPLSSPKKLSSRKTSGLLKIVHKKQLNKPVSIQSVFLKQRKASNRYRGNPAKVAGKPQCGDSKYCRMCDRFFSRRIKLIQHFASMHVQLFTVTRVGSTVSYLCHLCQKTFSLYFKYINHVSCHSQAIVQKFKEMCDGGSPKGSCHSSKHKGNVGQNVKKHGDASHKNMVGRNIRTGLGENERRRGRPRKITSSFTAGKPVGSRDKEVPLPLADRRSSARAAQKQALTKIYISSLGITSTLEPLKENNKRRVSSDEKSPTDTRPKRSRVTKSTVDMDSNEDEENTDDSSIENEGTVVKTTINNAALHSSAQYKSVAGEKASMDTNSSHKSCKQGHGDSSLHLQCPQSGSLPCASPQVSSPSLAAARKPSFLDSFLSFVSSRSPEAPLPIHQTKRRFSHLSDRVDKEDSSTVSSLPRRSSYDGGARPLQTPSRQLSAPVSVHHEKPLHCPASPSASSTAEVHSASTPKSAETAQTSKVKSSGFDNVYYYGEFEEQLTQQCKVNLGHRVEIREVSLKPSARSELAEKNVITVKQCIVNLGPKVNPALLPMSSSFAAYRQKNNSETGAQNVFESLGVSVSDTSDDLCPESDSDTVVAAGSVKSPLDEMEDTISLDNLPLSANTLPSSSTDAADDDEVCVEATLSVLPLPEVLSADVDVTAIVSPVASQNAVLNPASTTGSPSPTVEMVTVSTLSLGSPEAHPQSFSDHFSHNGKHHSGAFSAESDFHFSTKKLVRGQTGMVLLSRCVSDEHAVSEEDKSCSEARSSTDGTMSAVERKLGEHKVEVRGNSREQNHTSGISDWKYPKEQHETETCRQEFADHELSVGDGKDVDNCGTEGCRSDVQEKDTAPYSKQAVRSHLGVDRLMYDSVTVASAPQRPGSLSVTSNDTDGEVTRDKLTNRSIDSTLFLQDSVCDDVSSTSTLICDTLADEADHDSLPDASAEPKVSEVSFESTSISVASVCEMSVADKQSVSSLSEDTASKLDASLGPADGSTTAPVCEMVLEPSNSAVAAETLQTYEMTKNRPASKVLMAPLDFSKGADQSAGASHSKTGDKDPETSVLQDVETGHNPLAREAHSQLRVADVPDSDAGENVSSSEATPSHAQNFSSDNGQAEKALLSAFLCPAERDTRHDEPAVETDFKKDGTLQCSTKLDMSACQTVKAENVYVGMIEHTESGTEMHSRPKAVCEGSDSAAVNSCETLSMAGAISCTRMYVEDQTGQRTGDEEVTPSDGQRSDGKKTAKNKDTEQDTMMQNIADQDKSNRSASGEPIGAVLHSACPELQSGESTDRQHRPSGNIVRSKDILTVPLTGEGMVSRTTSKFGEKLDSAVSNKVHEENKFVQNNILTGCSDPHACTSNAKYGTVPRSSSSQSTGVTETTVSVKLSMRSAFCKEQQSEGCGQTESEHMSGKDLYQVVVQPVCTPSEGVKDIFEKRKEHVSEVRSGDSQAYERIAYPQKTAKSEILVKRETGFVTEDGDTDEETEGEHVITIPLSSPRDSAADDESTTITSGTLSSQLSSDQANSRCTMSMLEFLQKSALHAFKESHEAEPAKIDDDSRAALSTEPKHIEVNTSQMIEGEWDTCDEMVNMVTLSQDCQPLQDGQTLLVSVISSKGAACPTSTPTTTGVLDSTEQSFYKQYQGTAHLASDVNSENCSTLSEFSVPDTSNAAVSTMADADSAATPGACADELVNVSKPVLLSSSVYCENELTPTGHQNSVCLSSYSFSEPVIQLSSIPQKPIDSSECLQQDAVYQPGHTFTLPMEVSHGCSESGQPQHPVDQRDTLCTEVQSSCSHMDPVCERIGNFSESADQIQHDPRAVVDKSLSGIQRSFDQPSVCHWEKTNWSEGFLQVSLCHDPSNDLDVPAQWPESAGEQSGVAQSPADRIKQEQVGCLQESVKEDQTHVDEQKPDSQPDALPLVAEPTPVKASDLISESVPVCSPVQTAAAASCEEEEPSILKHCDSPPADCAFDSDDEDGNVSLDLREETSCSEKASGCSGSVVADRSMLKGAMPGKSEDHSDLDSDLPELCIVPDPERVVIKRSFVRTAEKKQSDSCSVNESGQRKEEKGACSGNVEDLQDGSVSVVVDDYEVQVRPCKSSKSSQRKITTYSVEVKQEVEDGRKEASETVPPVSPTISRKPLLGVKSLRKKHKPEPFVWEVDGEEDGKKRARNERSLKAFRQKVSVAPFSWDADGGCQEGKVNTAYATSKKLCSPQDCGQSIHPLGSVREKVGSRCLRSDFENKFGSESKSVSLSESEKTVSCSRNGQSKGMTTRTATPVHSSVKQSVMHTSTCKQELSSDERCKSDDSGLASCGKYPAKYVNSPNSQKSRKSCAEWGRLAPRSAAALRSGSCDKTIVSSALSSSKNQSASTVSRKPFRKSRSCDIESSDGGPKVSFDTLESSATDKHIESTVTDMKPNFASKSPSTHSVCGLDVKKSAGSQAKSLQSRASTQLSETASQSSRPTRKQEHSSTGSKACSSDLTPRRLRMKRALDADKPSDYPNSTSAGLHHRHKHRRQHCESRPPRTRASSDKGQINVRQTRSRDSVEKDVNRAKVAAQDAGRTHGDEDQSVRKGQKSDAQSTLKSVARRGACLNTVSPLQSRKISQPAFGSSSKKGASSLQSASSCVDSPSSRNTTLVVDHHGGGSRKHASDTDLRDGRSRRRRWSGNSGTAPSGDAKTPISSVKKLLYGQTTESMNREPTHTPVASVKKLYGRTTDRMNREPTYTSNSGSLYEAQGPSSSRANCSQERKSTRVSSVKSDSTTVSAGVESDRMVRPVTAGRQSRQKQFGSSDLDGPACSFGDTPQTSQPIHKPYKSDTKHNLYLGAMVRRRKQLASWCRATSRPWKKACAGLSEPPQYEIIRVEPARTGYPSEEQRTQECRKAVELPPRTVHTKVSMDSMKSVLQGSKSAKSASDQKWLINRRKRSSDPDFPFSFMRARGRTQSK